MFSPSRYRNGVLQDFSKPRTFTTSPLSTSAVCISTGKNDTHLKELNVKLFDSQTNTTNKCSSPIRGETLDDDMSDNMSDTENIDPNSPVRKSIPKFGGKFVKSCPRGEFVSPRISSSKKTPLGSSFVLSPYESKDTECFISNLESKFKSRSVRLSPKSHMGSIRNKATTENLSKALLQNKRLEVQLLAKSSELQRVIEQKDAMKIYIDGLEAALEDLQRKFTAFSFVSSDAAPFEIEDSGSELMTSLDGNDINTQGPKEVEGKKQDGQDEHEGEDEQDEHEREDSSEVNDFKQKFMQKAFKSLLKARDIVSIRRHGEVLCALLGYSEDERREVCMETFSSQMRNEKYLIEYINCIYLSS